MIYLDNAATSFPKPGGMAEAMMEYMLSWCGNPGRSGHKMSRKTQEAIDETRADLANYFGIGDPARIIFTQNATAALNQAICGTLKPGDHVITTSMEHNSVLRPIIASGAEYTIVQCAPDGSLDPSKVEIEIRRNTKMIVCTHASNVTGTIMPIGKIKAICRKHNILLLVDASQSAGHIPVDVKGIDLLAAPGHKGLLGPMGTGFLYVRKGVEVHPLMTGGNGKYSKNLTPPILFPESFEVGTVNAPGIIGLGYSLRKLQQMCHLREHQMALTKALDEHLRNMKGIHIYGPEDCAKKVGIVTFNVEGRDASEIASLLSDEFGIATRAGFHCAGLAHKTIGTWDTGAVRMSVGVFQNMRQMQLAADAVYKISKLPPGYNHVPSRSGCQHL